MSEFLFNYGLFLAKAITTVIAIGFILGMIVNASRKGKKQTTDSLEITNLNHKYENLTNALLKELLPKKKFNKVLKEEKQKKKQKEKLETGEQSTKKVYVLDFHGDIKATAVAALREEITAILSQATPTDEVVIRLENAGGLVHEHGLAASQLTRIRQQNIPLTIAVDKVAASGGYLMACVANRIVAAPFAIIGSIGVLAQVPNFHRLLDKHGVDFEQFKAGELKRTVTMFGVNTDEDRKKVKEQLEDVHKLFKDFILQNRPSVDISQVATGEYWHATQALDLNLVDELITSDDYLINLSKEAELFHISFVAKKKLSEKVFGTVQKIKESIFTS